MTAPSPTSPWVCFAGSPWVLVTWALLYAAALYVRAATASLHDGDQPGIEAWRAWFRPVFWLLPAFALTCVTCRAWAVVACARRMVLVALAGTGLMALLTRGDGVDAVRVRPAQTERTLPTTVHEALRSPRFSNRSTMSVLGEGVLAVGLLLASGAARGRCDAAEQSPAAGTAAGQAGHGQVGTGSGGGGGA